MSSSHADDRDGPRDGTASAACRWPRSVPPNAWTLEGERVRSNPDTLVTYSPGPGVCLVADGFRLDAD